LARNGTAPGYGDTPYQKTEGVGMGDQARFLGTGRRSIVHWYEFPDWILGDRPEALIMASATFSDFK
jgi:hypothetical protein